MTENYSHQKAAPGLRLKLTLRRLERDGGDFSELRGPYPYASEKTESARDAPCNYGAAGAQRKGNRRAPDPQHAHAAGQPSSATCRPTTDRAARRDGTVTLQPPKSRTARCAAFTGLR